MRWQECDLEGAFSASFAGACAARATDESGDGSNGDPLCPSPFALEASKTWLSSVALVMPFAFIVRGGKGTAFVYMPASSTILLSCSCAVGKVMRLRLVSPANAYSSSFKESYIVS